MKKAAIFDLDGTLSDSIMSMKYSGDKTMAEFGYGPFSVQDYKYFVGDGAANLVKRALIKGGDTELTHFEAAYARYKEIFQANCMYQTRSRRSLPDLRTVRSHRRRSALHGRHRYRYEDRQAAGAFTVGVPLGASATARN